jgi:deoxyribonuclease (pyrimidine dimer)
MTRINCVPVQELCDQHLLAEYRELPRVPYGVLAGRLQPSYPDAPAIYTLGPGHIKFFVNKCAWLMLRHDDIRVEMLHRGMVPALSRMEVVKMGELYRKRCWGLWQPSNRDMGVNRQRLSDRLATMKREPRWTDRSPPDYYLR